MARAVSIGLIAFLTVLVGSDAVWAQPESSPTEQSLPATEEAPPEVVIAPPPMAAPPVKPSDVKPATPPKDQVALRPDDSTKRRTRQDIAILQALDKVTAETVRFEARVGQPVRYKTLVITVRACEQSADDEPQSDSMVYLNVESQPRAAPGKPTPAPREVFRGWMYASSPSLSALEHPVYDAWLITCRASRPESVAAR